MTNTEYIIKTVSKDIEKQLAHDTAILEAWENVTYNTKKDGTPFQNLQKNINGAKVEKWLGSIQPGENVITVYAYTNKTGYINDQIYAYAMYEDIAADDPRKAKTENLLPKITYLKQVYTYDIDDIKEAIANHIEYMKQTISDKKKQLAAIKKSVTVFAKAYDKARAELEKTAVFENGNKQLFYSVLKAVQRDF